MQKLLILLVILFSTPVYAETATEQLERLKPTILKQIADIEASHQETMKADVERKKLEDEMEEKRFLERLGEPVIFEPLQRKHGEM